MFESLLISWVVLLCQGARAAVHRHAFDRGTRCESYGTVARFARVRTGAWGCDGWEEAAIRVCTHPLEDTSFWCHFEATDETISI